MGLHDRLRSADEIRAVLEAPAERVHVDPYAELKGKIHHACIAKLGPDVAAIMEDPAAALLF